MAQSVVEEREAKRYYLHFTAKKEERAFPGFI